MKVKITELVGEGRVATVEKFDIAEAIRPWFPEPPPDVDRTITDLETSIMADDWARANDLAQFLGLDVELVAET